VKTVKKQLIPQTVIPLLLATAFMDNLKDSNKFKCFVRLKPDETNFFTPRALQLLQQLLRRYMPLDATVLQLEIILKPLLPASGQGMP